MNPPLRHWLLIPLLAAFAPCVQAQDFAPRNKASLLTIGNSFTLDSTSHLLQLAQAGNKDLILLNLAKGGCSLQEHAMALQAMQADPQSIKADIYKVSGPAGQTFPPKAKVDLLDGLKAGSWDFITIHQYSKLSFKPESYEPFAGELVKFLKAHAPKSEILIHESWAYREDDPLFKDGSFTSDQMHAALKAAYTKMATDHQLRIIPIGDAFQAARKTPEWQFQRDPSFDFANPPKGGLPKEPRSLNVGWIWRKAAPVSETPDVSPDNDRAVAAEVPARFILDAHHANVAGDYLGSCVFYEVLFQDDVTRLVSYVPKGLTPEQAASLRQIAHDTVAEQRQAEAGYLQASQPASPIGGAYSRDN